MKGTWKIEFKWRHVIDTKRLWNKEALVGSCAGRVEKAATECWVSGWALGHSLRGPVLWPSELRGTLPLAILQGSRGPGSQQQQEQGTHSREVSEDPQQPLQKDWCQTASHGCFQQGQQQRGCQEHWDDIGSGHQGDLGSHQIHAGKTGMNSDWDPHCQAPVSPPKIVLKKQSVQEKNALSSNLIPKVTGSLFSNYW